MESNQSNNTSNEDIIAELLTLTCEVSLSGTKYYYNKEDRLHRIHGPAILEPDGAEYWYKNGVRHREDGPAVVWGTGHEVFYIYGISYTKEEFIQWQINYGTKPSE